MILEQSLAMDFVIAVNCFIVYKWAIRTKQKYCLVVYKKYFLKFIELQRGGDVGGHILAS